MPLPLLASKIMHPLSDIMDITTQGFNLPAHQPRELRETGLVYSIGPAVDLVRLQDHMAVLSRKPLGDPIFNEAP